MNVAFSYKGNISSIKAYERVEKDEVDAFLLDVRTTAEHAFVGYPKLKNTSKYSLIEWVKYPDMSQNTTFIEQCLSLLSRHPAAIKEIYILCRSGHRSNAAGQALEQAQTTIKSLEPITVYNVMSGFEGDRDPQSGHRSVLNGWKVEGLPWQQH